MINVGATTSCPLLTTYSRQTNWNNLPSDVAKLQAFLKESQGLDVDVTGIFDQKTEDAVKAFQAKYMSDVMGPWEATRTSGMVYITTLKKINEIACNQPTTLTPAEQAIIQAYIQNNNNASSTQDATLGTTVGPQSPLASSTALVTDNQANTASVANASILSRFWSFIKALFQ